MSADLPASLVANPRISTWLSITDDGAIALRVGKVELGQGILTALIQIAAHELDVPPEAVRAAATNTASSPDEGLTAGSLSITFSGAAVRRVCAETRELFRRAAAHRSGLDTAQIQLVSGVFVAPDGSRIASYGDLSGVVDLHVQVGDPSLQVEFAAPTSKDLARVDLPDKVFGRPRFIHDLAFDGMVHARVVRPPGPGAHLEDAPLERVSAMPGVDQVVRDGDFLAVIARREGQATRAAEALASAAAWSAGIELPDADDLQSWLRTAETQTHLIRDDGARHDDAPVVVSATFSRPFLAHASIGPSCAIAHFDDGRLQVWSHSQGVFTLARAIAAALDLSPDAVVVQHVEGPGSYGHNAADDVAMDAALLATRIPGRHVRVQWSRGDEFAWEPFGPAMVGDVTASADENGRITDWSYELWTNGHTARPGYAPRNSLLADAHRARSPMLPAAVDPPAERGHGSARNAEPYYDIAKVDVTVHRLLTMPIRTSSLRSLGSHLNTFALESVIDELARATGRDPLQMRLDHLSDPRARDALRTVAEAADWGAPRPDGHGRGIAFCRYKNRGSYCAVVADVEATDRLHVRRLTIAVDVGRVVNADGVRNQIEGGAIQTISWALFEQVRFDRHTITSIDWESYPIARFSEVPAIDVHLLDRPDDAPLGAGEATQGPVTAAIGNALADAIGVRVYSLPFTPDQIVAAINAAP
ncbi:xanthine dehydrogenase family protein molybdopterin-binding subunit [Mycolicibacterium sp. S2-37]|uniref:xanthine dehydrogenase family protein molybdopterin-binding subunit n=1 Tax=Mycolicibacterium sp. S2-37 TaxID=2810297 RepID=UPI001A9515B3|nr:molybdopterin cofactor-binding domain-containing protein [Mycolicibacterium sp. S2-37]MBO0680204.1 xanthine dehydrogenase family protein molybdopterin-binding subunit [Mycolicibacterium sp. S2-37]